MQQGLYANLEKYRLPYPEAIFEISYFKVRVTQGGGSIVMGVDRASWLLLTSHQGHVGAHLPSGSLSHRNSSRSRNLYGEAAR